MARAPHRIGALRDRVRVERRQVNAAGDGAGNFEDAWTGIGPAANLPADIIELRGDESVLQAKLKGQAVTLVVMRADSFTRTVTTDDRIIDVGNDRVFNVRHAPAPDRRHFIEFLCEAGAAIG